MGKMENGIFGPFTGKIGTLVGSYRYGVYYVKSAPVRTKPFTPAELMNQNRFRVAETWLKPLLAFVRIGFNNNTPKRGKNAAKSYLMKHALKGDGMEVSVNPALMKVSAGRLALPSGLMVIVDGLNLRFEWDAAAVFRGNHRDQVMMLAYDVELKRAYAITAGNFRFEGFDVLQLPEGARGRTVHVYAGFSGHDRLDQSDSFYFGGLVI